MPPGRPAAVRGIGLFVLSTVLFAAMDGLIKWLTAEYPTHQLVFFRSLFGMVPVAVGLALGIGGRLMQLRTRRLGRHLLRGCISTASLGCFFYAFRHLPLAEVYAISFAAPLFATGLSIPLLGERVGWRRWSAILVGFGGVVLMLRPGEGGLDALLEPGTLAAIGGAVLYALTAVTARDMARTDSSAAMVVYSSLVPILAGGALLLVLGGVAPDADDLALLGVVGLLGGCGSLAFTQAFRHAAVGTLAPFEYLAMIWAVAIGYAVWAELPDAWIWAGSGIVIGSGLFILHRETLARRAMAEERAA